MFCIRGWGLAQYDVYNLRSGQIDCEVCRVQWTVTGARLRAYSVVAKAGEPIVLNHKLALALGRIDIFRAMSESTAL